MYHNVEIRDNEFLIPEWDMEKQFENHHVVMPLLKEPIVNAAAFASNIEEEGNEAIFMAAVLDGILDALSQVNMRKIVEILLDGVWFSTPSIKKKEANFKNLQEAGLDISDVLIVCVHVIKINYGAYLKKDLPDSLKSLFMVAPSDKEENPS